MNECKSRVSKLIEQLLSAQLVERNPEKATSLLTDDVIWLGVGDDGDVSSRQQAHVYFVAEARANPGTYSLEILGKRENIIADGCGAATVKARISRDYISIIALITATTKPENGMEKICSLHISMHDKSNVDKHHSPFTLSRKFADNTYHDFIEESIGTGIAGGYFEAGLPFYTANGYFLEMLGYSSEDEYVAAIDGLIENSFHPDDRIDIRSAIHAQIGVGKNYTVKFRMRKKDGSYIWVESKGKTVTAEGGRTVLISLYNDITENEQNIARLNRMADQLRLYRISQNAGTFRVLVNENVPLLYGNDRLYQILGYEGEDGRQKLAKGCMQYVHPNDQAMVKSKIEQALSSDDKYTQWVMRIFTDDGNFRYIQVIGDFINTKDGYVMEGIEIDVTEQKLVERQLYERNAMFDLLLDNSNLSMWEYDIKTHMATLISSKKHKRPLSLEGTPNYPECVIEIGFIKESSVEVMRELLKKVDMGISTVEADIWYAPKGEDAWCDHTTYVNIKDKSGNIIRTVGIAEDVTEQRVAQQQYEEELQYQKSLQNENLLVKVRCNLTQNLVESYIASASIGISADGMSYNTGVEALASTGYSEEERQLIRHMLNTERVTRAFEQGEHFYTLDYRRKTNDGKVIWVNTSVKTYRDTRSGELKSFMYTTNIDKEKANEQMIRAVAAAEHDYIMLVNLNTDDFELFSGKDCQVIMPPSSGNNFSNMVKRVNQNGVDAADVERAVHDMTPSVMRKNLKNSKIFSAAYASKLADGTLQYKKIQYFWLDEKLGQLIMTRSDITDLTCEQQRQQELLKNALNQAKQASNAKTDFLSKMSHEIRTPMNAIIGMNALAAQNINDAVIAADCISKVGISARYLLTLINDILDMSRIESGKVNLRNEEIPFREFLNGLNTIIYDQATANEISYDSIIMGFVEDYYVGDAMKLQQILINLLGNAVKFTPRGGKIQLLVSQERIENKRARMRFVVNDTGIGISEEFQKVMFEPFEQEDNDSNMPYGGTGLGLAITQNLVKLMGGNISVNSILGVGTEFVVNIPLEVSADKVNQKSASGMNLYKMNALLVDDEIMICEQMQSILSDIGMKVEWVTSGHQAVERVRERFERKNNFDIILIDWKMSEMDGIETARQIRSIVGQDVTIIIVTAYEWAEIEKEAKAAGVNLLITKPLFKSSLISTLEMLFTDKVQSNTTPQIENYDFTGKRILLVEDHVMNIEVAKRLLNSKGADVEVAENGLMAIEAYASKPVGYFAAILMDIRMPVMDGLTATRSIRQLKKATAKTIPIIAMSANAFEEDVEKSMAAGMNAHLSKPIEPQQLFATLNSCIMQNKDQGNKVDA